MKRFSWMAGVLVLSTSALASEVDTARALSLAGGIASPSRTSALLQNPAGLTLNERTRILGTLNSDNDNFDPLSYGGGVFLGNGTVGGGAEIQRIDSARTDLDLGVGFMVSDISLGVHLNHDLSASGAGWRTDLGAIFNTKGKWRIGAEIFNAFDGVSGFGAGLATNLSSDVTFAVDASTNQDVKGLVVKPAIGVDLKVVQFTYGYGIHVDKNATSFIPEGHALGLGFKLSQSAYLTGYYNQLNKYWLGVTFDL
jgi:hypothetical protein